MSTLSGLLIKWTGRFRECILLGWAVWSVGLGLYSTLDEHSSVAKQVGYAILTGVGVGFTLQPALVAIQSVVDRKTMAVVTSARKWVRFLCLCVVCPDHVPPSLQLCPQPGRERRPGTEWNHCAADCPVPSLRPVGRGHVERRHHRPVVLGPPPLAKRRKAISSGVPSWFPHQFSCPLLARRPCLFCRSLSHAPELA